MVSIFSLLFVRKLYEIVAISIQKIA